MMDDERGAEAARHAAHPARRAKLVVVRAMART